MADLRIDITEKDGILFLYLIGEIGLSEEYKFRQKVQNALAQDPSKLVVNLNNITLLSSYGIAAIVNIYKQMKKQNKSFAIICPRNHVFDCLTIAGTDKIIPIFENEDEALEHYKSKKGSG